MGVLLLLDLFDVELEVSDEVLELLGALEIVVLELRDDGVPDLEAYLSWL